MKAKYIFGIGAVAGVVGLMAWTSGLHADSPVLLSKTKVPAYDATMEVQAPSGPAAFASGYASGFEPIDGFAVGFIDGQPGDADPSLNWTVTAAMNSLLEGHIDDVNPFAGTQHLRISHDPAPGFPIFVDARIPAGAVAAGLVLGSEKVTMTMQVAIDATDGADYTFGTQSLAQGFLTSQVRFDWQGRILVRDNVPSLGGAAFYYAADWDMSGAYQEFTHIVDGCFDTMEYYYGGVKIWPPAGVPDAGTTWNGGTERVDQILWFSDNFPGSNLDVDDMLIERDDCPWICGDDEINPGEECDGTALGDCQQGCHPAGHDLECRCIRDGETPCEATPLPNDTTLTPGTHGGWFSFVADTPSVAIDTCGTDGYDSLLAVYDGPCDGALTLINFGDDCATDPFQGAADPLAPCFDQPGAATSPYNACICVGADDPFSGASLVPGQTYYVRDFGLPNTPGATDTLITLSKRLTCGEVWENGACCDRADGTCTDDVAPGDCNGPLQVFTATKLCETVDCDIAMGACCNTAPGSGGSCSETTSADCPVGPQQTWTIDATCGDITCSEATGSCCNTLSGACSTGVLQSACTGSRDVWSKGGGCSACTAATGACCDSNTGECTDNVTLANCSFEGGEWTEGAACDSVECELPFIPTVSEWGLVILTLLLLVGAKVYFGRRQALA